MRKILTVGFFILGTTSLFAGDFDALDYSTLTSIDQSMHSLIEGLPSEDQDMFTQGLLVVQTEVEETIRSSGQELSEAQMISIVKDALSEHSVQSVINIGRAYPFSRQDLPSSAQIDR